MSFGCQGDIPSAGIICIQVMLELWTKLDFSIKKMWRVNFCVYQI